MTDQPALDTTTMNAPRLSIRITVVAVFIIATLFTAVVAIGLQYHFSRELAMQTALSQFKVSATGTGHFLTGADSRAIQATKLLSSYPNLISDDRVAQDTYELFAGIMRANPMLYGIYIGFEDGRFYELVNLDSAAGVREQLRAAPQDRWVMIEVFGGQGSRKRRFEYYNGNFELRIFREEKSEYDLTQRPWFVNATPDSVYKTRPYLFQHLQQPGQTYSIKLPSSRAVLAIDVTLDSVSSFLDSFPLTPGSEIYLYQQTGELIASNHDRTQSQPDLPLPSVTLSPEERALVDQLGVLRVSNELNWPPIDYAISGEPQGYDIDLIRSVAQMIGLEIEFVNGYDWPTLKDMFERQQVDILHPVLRTTQFASTGDFSQPILKLPYTIITRQGVAPIKRLSQLDGKTLAIPAGWSLVNILREDYPDINIVETGTTRQALDAVVDGKVDGTIDSSVILHHTANQYFYTDLKFHEPLPEVDAVLPHDYYLLVHERISGLTDILNRALERFLQENREQLEERWFPQPDKTQRIPALPTIPYSILLEAAEDSQRQNTIIDTEIDNKHYFVFVTPLGLDEVYKEFFSIAVPADDVLAGPLEKVKNSILITSACLLLLIPISWLFANPIVNPIRRLAKENEKIKNRRYDDVEYCSSAIIEIHELSKSMLEMSDSIKQHETQQKELMQSLVQLIAQAIDDKSPYTAGHCARVPELAVMIAEAAERSHAPPFRDFRFNNDDEYREFSMAAWLHDCGKITTPEHIVDKSTKLEVIYNRIHEIRTRFEVLWRDAEIDYLRKAMHSPDHQLMLRKELERKQQQLQDDFVFIANANIGSEFLSPDDAERIKRLAQTPWLRHFDDQLGLSADEQYRFKPEPRELPVRETLLADKPHHRIQRTRAAEYDPKYGIDMDIPELLYNQGELYNLLVSRGTLTTEDRFKINEHMISTIKMLESLPFPAELSKVPRYASTHHETLKGTGYPRRLQADELSLLERMIAVADIFEALTAADRPYKSAKPVSEAVNILSRMVAKGHIDRDVFILFLTSGVYLDYAKRFLHTTQIDEVNIQEMIQAASMEPQ